MLITRNFCGNMWYRNHSVTVWKLREFTLTLFWQKFRESNVFIRGITKESVWRNIFSVSVVENWRIYSHRKKIRQINALIISLLVKSLLSQKFCQKREKENRENFRNFHNATICRKNSVKVTFTLEIYSKLIWRKKICMAAVQWKSWKICYSYGILDCV